MEEGQRSLVGGSLAPSGVLSSSVIVTCPPVSPQNWLGYTKKKAPVGFHRVVEILHKNGAPAQVSGHLPTAGKEGHPDSAVYLYLFYSDPTGLHPAGGGRGDENIPGDQVQVSRCRDRCEWSIILLMGGDPKMS